MNFTNPENVISPKGVVKDVRVLLNTGENGWSLAKLLWEGRGSWRSLERPEHQPTGQPPVQRHSNLVRTAR